MNPKMLWWEVVIFRVAYFIKYRIAHQCSRLLYAVGPAAKWLERHTSFWLFCKMDRLLNWAAHRRFRTPESIALRRRYFQARAAREKRDQADA